MENNKLQVTRGWTLRQLTSEQISANKNLAKQKLGLNCCVLAGGGHEYVRGAVAVKCKHIILEGVQRGGRIVGSEGRERCII